MSLSSLPEGGTYKLLPSSANIGIDAERASTQDSLPRKCRTINFKSALVRFLGALAIMYATFTGVRALSRLSVNRPFFMTPCHGLQRNMSKSASLPWHYQLPSGDRIPSVALGMAAVIYDANV